MNRSTGTRIAQILTAGTFAGLAAASPALAQNVPQIAQNAPMIAPVVASAPFNSGDTAWLLTASALILCMTLPGLALFYGGLVRARNLLSVMVQCFAICCMASLIWAICGYSLAFSDGTPFLGGLDNLFLANLADVRPDTFIPESLYALFQMTFAIITPALFIGAFVERVRFGWVMGFSALWLLLVYIPVAKWMWGGGWLSDLGALDFAGGIVVHTTAGVAALVTAFLIGPRRAFKNGVVPPHSPAFTMIGAGMLWFGWFGFNGGSALAAADSAATAILNTHLAASAAALMWIAIERAKIGKATSIGIVTGAVAGLATVTPAAGYIAPGGAMLLGAIGSAICFFAVLLVKQRLKIDDSLDVFAVHGVGGMTGSILLAFFAFPVLGGAGFDDPAVTISTQLVAQIIAVGVVALWSAVVTAALAWLVSLVLPMRVDQEAEYDGLDLHSHGERAYDFD